MWGNASLLKPCSCWFKAQFLQHSSLTPFSMSLGFTNMSQHGRKPRLYWILLKLIDTFANLSLRDWFKNFCFTPLRLYPLPSKLGTNLIPSHHSFQGHGRTRSYLDCKGNQVTPQNIYIYISNIPEKARARNGCKAALFKNKRILWNDWPCLRVERIVTVRSIRPGWQPEPDRVCVRQG